MVLDSILGSSTNCLSWLGFRYYQIWYGEHKRDGILLLTTNLDMLLFTMCDTQNLPLTAAAAVHPELGVWMAVRTIPDLGIVAETRFHPEEAHFLRWRDSRPLSREVEPPRGSLNKHGKMNFIRSIIYLYFIHYVLKRT